MRRSRIPWDQPVCLFNKRNPAKSTGRPALNPKVLIGAVIIKHMLNLDNRETVAQITENMYLQYLNEGQTYAIEFDLGKFFDKVNHFKPRSHYCNWIKQYTLVN
ncbi:transposase [Algoriphagus sp. D3-2-R+10]|uniref:transposase n=1 Tax=Algoriphagus aurantiacus TaxID=3103948 RepID=UPI002B3867E3|nr:transposase [Algoriphagus sp. D3-2-R+10]MEB2774507.1 transposase [Algoriphagus sp. D3-2-R+10]